jgi:endonuclease/exonuclease/phosphatase (EEP) superfamily protein YafD
LAALAPWAVIGWALSTVLLLCGRWWWVAFLVTALLVLQLAWTLPPWSAGSARGERPDALPVRVMTINVKVAQADLGTIERLVREHGVDLLVVEEGQPGFFHALDESLHGQLPNTVFSPDPTWAQGTAMWSRWPIQNLGLLPGRQDRPQRVLLRVPGAVAVTVTGVHTLSPVQDRVPGWRSDLANLTWASKRTAGPQLMLGDFNASRDHAPFRQLLATGLVDAAEAARVPVWKAVTWPADRRRLPALIRLDHVLVTADSIGVTAVRVVAVPGTDHRGVIADLRFDRAAVS